MNRRMQINAELKTLFNLPYVNTMHSFSLKQLQRKINCCIANLNSLEIDTDNWNPIFVYICSTKLPRETRREFKKTLHDCAEMPSWTDLDLFLTNTFKELISVDDVPNSNPYTHPKPKHVQENKNHVNRKGNTLHTMVNFDNDNYPENDQCEQEFLNPTQNYPKTHKRICVLCDSDYALKKCSSFNSLELNERIDFVKENAICYNCLTIGHKI
ncbi:hypothetical protein CVS40_4837 [Lucilia cuprina]|nr:hypothetical protein CVS40_4837 [Lucilia cuprina]